MTGRPPASPELLLSLLVRNVEQWADALEASAAAPTTARAAARHTALNMRQAVHSLKVLAGPQPPPD